MSTWMIPNSLFTKSFETRNFKFENPDRILFFLGGSAAQKCARPKSGGFKMRAAAQTAGQRGSKMRADAPGRTRPKAQNLVSSPKTQKSGNQAVLNIRNFENSNFRFFIHVPVRLLGIWGSKIYSCRGYVSRRLRSIVSCLFHVPVRHLRV